MNRRTFVQGFAVFGSVMALPKALLSKPLPPAQNLVVLPAEALTDDLKTFVWIDRVPLTGGYRFELKLAQKLQPLFRMTDGYQAGFLPSQIDLRFELTTTPQELSRLIGHAMSGVQNEIIFKAPKDNHAQIIRAYLSDLTSGMSAMEADVVQVVWQATEEPKQIAAIELPNYLRQPYKAA